MTLDEEKELVHKAKTNPEAFSLLYEEYYSLLLNYAVRRTGNVEIAKDIVSETFYKAIKKLWLFQWRNIPISAWLYRIANNELKQYYRKSRYRAESFELMLARTDREPMLDYNLEEEVVQAQEELEKHEQFLFFRQKIAELPIKYQEVLSLRYFEEKSLKEICEILGKAEGTVKSLLHRGVEKLKNMRNSS
ncbi:RNA polymerase sigma factor [Paenibacillus alkaliterrae]|uniref:RNA polymerase sigma factor n=1 Tax=Paenibacillus alkaliterrae TaxID=320909 RepID=UPI001F434582|nr:RNA polymerase sigma factor [Paenibacillus alkaliterrae]MCF2940199.1 RNA polymerase sigma factor [Paenibacillus alkaliterrae]